MSKFKLFSKWTALVGLNSLLCFILAISHGFANIQAISGIVLGIFTLVYVYMIIDFRLYQRKKEVLRKWLFFGVLIQFVTQMFIPLYLSIGIMTIASITTIFQQISYAYSDLTSLFFGAYLVTVLIGLLLSMSVFLISSLVGFIEMKIMPYFCLD